ncbi:MAG TPA: ArsA-related P-loop ATPase [Solirubrobacteraceae bacterium]|nr:ArsA-related P-loop ATPase [Solirubrobacteraceae bacterium]
MTRLDSRLADKHVVVCAGAGGVGKSTISATVALGLAARGGRVAVVTIDPARRLAEALGLDELGNEPQLVDAARFAREGLELRGELWAMMLDAKRTFDELIARLAPDPRTREQILGNPIYEHLSTAVAGTQEYTAMAKLFELDREGAYDTIVLDTPPSRSAIEFLQAPDRLMSLLEGRALRAFIRPTRRVLGAAGVVFTVLRRITGVGLLDELTTFFGLLSGLLDGFRARAVDVRELLTDPGTGFLVITSPEHAPLEEAIFFAGELERNGMRRSGVIVNRFHPLDPHERGAAVTAARLRDALGEDLARRVADTHAEVQELARGDQAALERLCRDLCDPDPVCLRDREGDVQDVDSLVDLERELFSASGQTESATAGRVR